MNGRKNSKKPRPFSFTIAVSIDDAIKSYPLLLALNTEAAIIISIMNMISAAIIITMSLGGPGTSGSIPVSAGLPMFTKTDTWPLDTDGVGGTDTTIDISVANCGAGNTHTLSAQVVY